MSMDLDAIRENWAIGDPKMRGITTWNGARETIAALLAECERLRGLVDAAREQRDACLSHIKEALTLAESWKARAEAAENRIKEGTEAWGVYRLGLLDRAETALTHCHATDVRRVLILDDPDPEATA